MWQCHWRSPIIPCLKLLQVFGWCLPPPILLPLCQLCLMFCRHSHLYLTFSLEKCLPRALKCSQNSYVDTLFPSVMIFGDRVLMRLSSHDGICALIRKDIKKKNLSLSFFLFSISLIGKNKYSLLWTSLKKSFIVATTSETYISKIEWIHCYLNYLVNEML